MPVSWGLDGSAEPTTRWIGGVQALPGLPPALPGGADPAVERLRLLGVDALAEGEGIGGELLLALGDRGEELLQIAVSEQLATLLGGRDGGTRADDQARRVALTGGAQPLGGGG